MARAGSFYMKLIGVLVLVAVFFFGRRYWRPGADDLRVVPEVPRPVKVMTIEESLDVTPHSYPAHVQASRSVDLAFEVPGRLTELTAKEGEKVRKNDVLAKLDAADYKNRLAAAKAKVSEAEQQFRRYESLVEDGVVSKASFDEKRAVYETAKADAEVAEKALRDTILRAPFDGVVSKVHVENFQGVQAKQPVVGYQYLRELEIVTHVPETDIYHARYGRGGRLTAVLETDPGREHVLRFKEVSTQADPVTQTYEVKLLMTAPADVNVLPGMTATVKWTPIISADKAERPYLIPVTAVLGDEEGRSWVWVVNPESMRLTKKEVSIGEMTGGEILVTDGLMKGQTILIAGVHYARENMLVSTLKGSADLAEGEGR